VTSCPECASTDIDVVSEDSEEYDEYGGSTVLYCQCQNCGCKFSVHEYTRVDVEIEKHGDTLEVDEDAEFEKKNKVSQNPQSS